MKITTKEIRSVLDRVLREFEESGSSEWEIEKDYYWEVDSSCRYDSYGKPEEFTIGQLSDDIQVIQGVASGRDDPVAPILLSVASLLRLAGELGVVGVVAQERRTFPGNSEERD